MGYCRWKGESVRCGTFVPEDSNEMSVIDVDLTSSPVTSYGDMMSENLGSFEPGFQLLPSLPVRGGPLTTDYCNRSLPRRWFDTSSE